MSRRGRTAILQLAGRTHGAIHRLRPCSTAKPLDDVGLAHKVESILFRDSRVPKGNISVNAEGGAVFLRGQLEDAELIADLTESVRRIAGVREVVNLLHQPGTPAPHRE
jgi:osmotically-inducible protein OsmY